MRAGAQRIGATGSVAICAAMALTATLGARISGAAPGDLDDRFGTAGSVTTDFAGGDDEARAVAVQADGLIITAGFAATPGRGADFALSRHRPDGTLDPAFGTGGRVVTDFSAITAGEGAADESQLDDEIEAVALQPDGSVVVAGCVRCLSPASDFAVARYLPDGTLDASFGEGGLATADFSDIPGRTRLPEHEILVDGAKGVALARDGNVVVLGCVRCLTRASDFGLARFTPDGRPDPSFDGDGRRVVDFAGSDVSNDTPGALVLQSDGKIVAVGFAGVTRRLGLAAQGTTTDFALARLLPDGAFDITFGEGGRVTTDLTGNSQDGATAAAIGPDGKIVAAGFVTAQGGFDFAVARYDTAGRLDPTFGRGGVVTTDFSARDDYGYPEFAHAVAVGPDGSVVAAGCTSCTRPQSDVAIVRYTATGTPDPTFGREGRIVTDYDGGRDEAFGVTLGPDGHIIPVGTSDRTASGVDFVLARYRASLRSEVPDL